MTLGYGLLTLGALFIYTAIKNMSIRDIVLDRPGPGQPADIAPELQAGVGSGVSSGGGGGKVPTGGSWGGAKAVVDHLTPGMSGSTKRSTQSTSTGGVSDHWEGCKECYAKDVPPTESNLKTIMKRLGAPYKKGQTVELTKNLNGFRIQVLARTMTGGNHFTHWHVGARKLGYTP